MPNDENIVTEEPSPNLCLAVLLERPESQNLLEQVNNQEVPFEFSVTSDSVRHYCISIDLRSVQLTAQNDHYYNPFYIQYSYAFFGHTNKVKTSAFRVESGSEIVLKDGFFAFNLATSESQLIHTFTKVSLVLEFIEKAKHDVVIGVGHLNLLDALNTQVDDENRRVLSRRVSIVNDSKEALAEVQVIMCIQDLGMTDFGTYSTIDQTNNGCMRDESDKDTTIKQIESLFVEAAVEIEVWKHKKISQFTVELKKKEADYLKMIMENNPNQKNAFDERERFLESALKSVRSKEEQLEAKELELREKEKRFILRYENLDNEIAHAISAVKDVYESKLTAQLEKIKLIEEAKLQLEEKLLARQTPKERLLEAKNKPVATAKPHTPFTRTYSIPNSVRVASKQL